MSCSQVVYFTLTLCIIVGNILVLKNPILQRNSNTTLSTMAKADAPSEADSYERATAFLSGWIEDSLLVPTAKIVHQTQQHHQRQFSPPVPDLPLPSTSGTLRRRNIYSSDGGGNTNEEAINSHVSSIRTSLMLHEQHQNQNLATLQRGGIASPSCIGAVFETSSGVVGSVPPLPFDARPTAKQQPLTREHGGSRRSAAPSLRSTRSSSSNGCGEERRRSTEDSTARPQPDINKKHGAEYHNSSSSSKHEKSSRKPPNSRRHSIDCERSSTSSNSSYPSIIPPSRAGESLLRDGFELHSSLSMSSLYDHQRRSRSSSRHRVHWSRSDGDLISPSLHRHHNGGRSKKEDASTMVVSLPWTDHAGNAGHYTGEVNTLIQPHGSGALQYDCGTVVKGSWNNGNPTARTSPVVEKEVIKKAVAVEAAKTDGAAATASGNAPTSRKNGDEKKSSSKPLNHPTKTKSSRKKSRGHTNNMAMEDKPFTTNATKSASLTQPTAQPSLDRLSELDGPPNFDLGDTLNSTKYQIIESNPTKALQLIHQLRIHDFAWILRSSREWTYAIIADFPVERGEEVSIRFVIDKFGSTKTLKMKHWTKCIRLVDKSH